MWTLLASVVLVKASLYITALIVLAMLVYLRTNCQQPFFLNSFEATIGGANFSSPITGGLVNQYKKYLFTGLINT